MDPKVGWQISTLDVLALAVIALVILVIAALIKYVFFR